jgi:hypothetical protein
VGGLGEVMKYHDTFGTGDHWWWVVAYDEDGTPFPPAGPVSD